MIIKEGIKVKDPVPSNFWVRTVLKVIGKFERSKMWGQFSKLYSILNYTEKWVFTRERKNYCEREKPVRSSETITSLPKMRTVLKIWQ